MKKILNERPEDFIDLKTAIPNCQINLKYYGKDNFVGQRIVGYNSEIVLLTRRTAMALKKVHEKLALKGYGLKIFDGYRPVRSVNAFFEWGLEEESGLTKDDFYPDLTRTEIFEKGFIASPSAHSRGSTVDLTLIDRKTNQELDMGGTFDYFSEVSYFEYANLTDQQKKNRILLQDVMVAEGFVPFKYEWWHFTLENEPYPDCYFDFEIR